ncbi:hypothetical protein [Geobacter argillaceus]|uniref:Uncharacterized protein n=1 Tax=Geobacter argillaceus TaxID=345631 RepID=A0A562VMW7_9BACT|nr:hypothetical protein [Geobacter argillaceus]TWJ19333.1 hypothetical protein JN12_01746 [Geobacter argillaceus]
MKKLLMWGAAGLLTSAILDPIIYAMLEQPIPWMRDLFMGGGGIACFWLLIKFRDEL